MALFEYALRMGSRRKEKNVQQPARFKPMTSLSQCLFSTYGVPPKPKSEFVKNPLLYRINYLRLNSNDFVCWWNASLRARLDCFKSWHCRSYALTRRRPWWPWQPWQLCSPGSPGSPGSRLVLMPDIQPNPNKEKKKRAAQKIGTIFGAATEPSLLRKEQ